jgi:ParB family chromosome partitioning protein
VTSTLDDLHLASAQVDAGASDLKRIPVDKIEPNPDNPRVTFRQGEFEQLIESISRYGVQVPISVYRQGAKYVLVDGQRRWMASSKLNKKDIPALIQQKPDELRNLLLMFNIHALREQWDLMTVALKLPKIYELLERKLRRTPRESEVAELTGVPSAWIRRSKMLLALPQHYRDMILEELNKPKSQQTISEDLFIEMERSLNVIESKMPDVIPNRDRARRVLLSKYQAGNISNIVDFRKLSKIARAKSVGADEESAREVIRHLFEDKDYSIKQAFDQSVADAYDERDLHTRLHALLNKLQQLAPDDLDEDTRIELRALVKIAEELLERE